jgi:hypothetical protein
VIAGFSPDSQRGEDSEIHQKGKNLSGTDQMKVSHLRTLGDTMSDRRSQGSAYLCGPNDEDLSMKN